MIRRCGDWCRDMALLGAALAGLTWIVLAPRRLLSPPPRTVRRAGW